MVCGSDGCLVQASLLEPRLLEMFSLLSTLRPVCPFGKSDWKGQKIICSISLLYNPSLPVGTTNIFPLDKL